jgi:hypothetical protein
VLSADVVSLALDKLTKKFAAPDEAPAPKRARLTAALRKIAKELTHLQEVVADGQASETVLSGVRERERRQRELQAELSAMDAGPAVVAAADTLKRDALRMLDDWKGLMAQNVSISRQLLRKLLGPERFVFYPRAKGSAQWYEIGVRPTLDRFFERLPVLKKAGTSPTRTARHGAPAPLVKMKLPRAA